MYHVIAYEDGTDFVVDAESYATFEEAVIAARDYENDPHALPMVECEIVEEGSDEPISWN
jgi:hypothetical protein